MPRRLVWCAKIDWLKGTGAVRCNEKTHRHYAVGLVLDGLPTTRASFIQHRREREEFPNARVMLSFACLVIVKSVLVILDLFKYDRAILDVYWGGHTGHTSHTCFPTSSTFLYFPTLS